MVSEGARISAQPNVSKDWQDDEGNGRKGEQKKEKKARVGGCVRATLPPNHNHPPPPPHQVCDAARVRDERDWKRTSSARAARASVISAGFLGLSHQVNWLIHPFQLIRLA